MVQCSSSSSSSSSLQGLSFQSTCSGSQRFLGLPTSLFPLCLYFHAFTGTLSSGILLRYSFHFLRFSVILSFNAVTLIPFLISSFYILSNSLQPIVLLRNFISAL
jgi:hypothetical protein